MIDLPVLPPPTYGYSRRRLLRWRIVVGLFGALFGCVIALVFVGLVSVSFGVVAAALIAMALKVSRAVWAEEQAVKIIAELVEHCTREARMQVQYLFRRGLPLDLRPPVPWEVHLRLSRQALELMRRDGAGPSRPGRSLWTIRWLLDRSARADLELVVADLARDKREMRQEGRGPAFVEVVLNLRVARNFWDLFLASAFKRVYPLLSLFLRK